MRVAVVGAGFTGLTAALRLSQAGHQVEVYEKEKYPGGLAAGFKMPSWDWPVEFHYHHWFKNDQAIIKLIKELGLKEKLFFGKPRTDIFIDGQIYPFSTPADILRFAPLSHPSRLRIGAVSLFLKALPLSLAIGLEKQKAYDWISRYYGSEVLAKIWEPLIAGKFGPYAKNINMAWFWSRIHKRTFALGYLAGGYQFLAETLVKTARDKGARFHFSAFFTAEESVDYDKVLFTAPSPVFTKIFSGLSSEYRRQLNSIPHLTALNLLIITREKFLPRTYWLNINDRSFPFIAVIQHTNFVSARHYGDQHLTWIGSYLPPDHPHLRLDAGELLELFSPYLARINPAFNFKFSILSFHLFRGDFAQPVFGLNYSRIKPGFATPLKNIFLANMDMVYPWDRGTNYAVELGENAVRFILSNK